MPYYWIRNEAIDTGLRRIAREQIDVGLRDVADDVTPMHRKVHSMRIRCKKVRGVLKLVEPLLADAYHVEDQRYRDAARQLAQNRDAEVCARTIAALNGLTYSTQTAQPTVSIAELERSRDILAQGRAAIDDWPMNLHGFYDVAPGFARTYRKCLAAWEGVLQEQTDENFHRLRRWVKYHWYHIRIVERLNKHELRKRRKKLRKLQITLGDAHDLVILEAFLALDNDADADTLRRARSRKAELYAAAIKAGGAVFDVSVSELVADCCSYWVDWDHA